MSRVTKNVIKTMEKAFPGTTLTCVVVETIKRVGSSRQFGNPYRKVRTFEWTIRYYPLETGTNNQIRDDLIKVLKFFLRCWKKESQKMKTGDYSRVSVDIASTDGIKPEGNMNNPYMTFDWWKD